MLSLRFNISGNSPEDERYIANPEDWFDNEFGEKYITGTMERDMIKDIDKCEVVSEHNVIHPLLGSMSPFDLSGTVKTLILVKNDPGHVFNGSFMGDLAAPWLLKIGEFCNRTVRFGYLPEFKEPFKIRIDNNDKIVTTWHDLVLEAYKFMNIDEEGFMRENEGDEN